MLVLGILVAVNYLASRRNHRWDLTAGKQFSVADQTRNILQKLDAPVKVLVFDKPTNFDTFRDRLDEYEYLSNRKLTAEYISPDKDPVRANQYKIQSYGTVVFNYKDRTETVVGTDEQQLTNTLIKVLSGAAADRLLPAGPRRARHRGERARRLQHDLPGARRRRTTRPTRWRSRRSPRCPPTPPCSSSRGRARICSRARWTRSSSTSIAAASCSCMLDPPDKDGQAAAHRTSSRC